jgi:hypothetical protein
VSWDLLVMAFDGPPPPIEEWTDDFRPPILGSAIEVRNRISSSFPGVDWKDPSWGYLNDDGYLIEFNVGKEEVVGSFMMHVRGGRNPLESIVKLCRKHGWYAYDCSTGEFIDLDMPSQEGWQGFQSFRDQVIGSLGKDSD